jgi:predicted nucleotidyltransferase
MEGQSEEEAMRPLAEVSLSDDDRRKVEAAARLLTARFPVAQVVLFGSKARGDDSPESDIDLLVLTTRQVTRAERSALTEETLPLWLPGGAPIELLVRPYEDWSHGLAQVLPIRQAVDREGVRVA